jgi:hypothetical protein
MREAFNTDYRAVAASQTDSVLGAAGSILERLIVTVATAATGTVSIKDGTGSAIAITVANTPIGAYSIAIGARCTGAGWKVTTGAGATVIAIGRFI